MFIEIIYESHTYTRTSKLGKEHAYERKVSIIRFRCDNCGEIFTRPRGRMDPKRLSNNYFHVCPSCDAKKFAQKKRIQKTQIWDMKASSLEDISKL